MLRRTSRTTSQNSLSEAEDITPAPINREAVLSPRIVDNDNDIDPNFMASYQFTLNHPIGAILIKLAQDSTAIAKKSSVRGVETNIGELCTAFHNFIQTDKADIESKINRTSENIEKAIIHKELNSHKINSAVDPPAYFSAVPVITSPQKLTEILKIFPRNIKFSGSKQDSSMSVIEYLNTLKACQDQCRLSEDEFLDRMLAASTGQAHELLLEWRNNGENVATIYHNLLINFDKRLSPEDAKTQLSNYKIPKTSTSAKAEGQIMILAGRVASALPSGLSRTNLYNLEACNAIIRALPSHSSSIVNNLYNQLSARLERAATFAELSRGMNLYRATIDKDIKQNGADHSFKTKKTFAKTKAGPIRTKFAAYNVNSHNASASMNNRPQNNNIRGAYNTSFAPKPFERKPQNTGFKGNTAWQTNKQGGQMKRNSAGKFQKNNNKGITFDGCSACGMKNHKHKDCRNMVNDQGKRVEFIPPYYVCTKCPSSVYPRLHHPAPLCPYRPGGPFHNKARN